MFIACACRSRESGWRCCKVPVCCPSLISLSRERRHRETFTFLSVQNRVWLGGILTMFFFCFSCSQPFSRDACASITLVPKKRFLLQRALASAGRRISNARREPVICSAPAPPPAPAPSTYLLLFFSGAFCGAQLNTRGSDSARPLVSPCESRAIRVVSCS